MHYTMCFQYSLCKNSFQNICTIPEPFSVNCVCLPIWLVLLCALSVITSLSVISRGSEQLSACCVLGILQKTNCNYLSKGSTTDQYITSFIITNKPKDQHKLHHKAQIWKNGFSECWKLAKSTILKFCLQVSQDVIILGLSVRYQEQDICCLHITTILFLQIDKLRKFTSSCNLQFGDPSGVNPIFGILVVEKTHGTGCALLYFALLWIRTLKLMIHIHYASCQIDQHLHSFAMCTTSSK